MGYYTRYKLEAKLPDDSQSVDDIIQQFRNQCSDAYYAINSLGNTRSECKWYEHEEDLKAFSKKHPSILFTLHGEGDNADDQWRKYFLNGAMQVEKAQIQIAPFDPAKLK